MVRLLVPLDEVLGFASGTFGWGKNSVVIKTSRWLRLLKFINFCPEFLPKMHIWDEMWVKKGQFWFKKSGENAYKGGNWGQFWKIWQNFALQFEDKIYPHFPPSFFPDLHTWIKMWPKICDFGSKISPELHIREGIGVKLAFSWFLTLPTQM